MISLHISNLEHLALVSGKSHNIKRIYKMSLVKLKVRPLQKSEEKEFRELTIYYIGLWYDDIDESFAQNIIDAHNRGFDPLGYFTKTKTIWVAECNNQMYGFLVGTEKRGGSVKLAPGIIKPEYQKKGIGTQLWRRVEDIYRQKQARKIYNHAPLYRFDLLKWVTTLGLNLEAHLKEHYRKGQDEYVAGKFLNRRIPQYVESIQWKDAEVNYIIRDYEESDVVQLENFILKELPQWCDEIDSSFVKSIIQAERRFKETFRKKGKKIFVIESEGNLIGCCICSPKRGGAVKLAPFLLCSAKANYKMGEEFLSYIKDFFVDEGYRKLYALVPSLDLGSCRTFRRQGFEIEGLLREPYKDGIDNLFFGKMIEVKK